MFVADYVHISRLRKSGLLQLSLNISRIFFFSYLVVISFPIEFDVWVRLCTHFETAKVRTFATVTQHFIARLNAYAKQYVPRRTGVTGGSSGGGGSSGRS
jgi:uncharacterized membrane protein YgcG